MKCTDCRGHGCARYLLVAAARQQGAEEGSLDAARAARRPFVRRTALPEGASPRAAMMARALAELDVYDQRGDDR